MNLLRDQVLYFCWRRLQGKDLPEENRGKLQGKGSKSQLEVELDERTRHYPASTILMAGKHFWPIMMCETNSLTEYVRRLLKSLWIFFQKKNFQITD
jgi:hypothetical protein